MKEPTVDSKGQQDPGEDRPIADTRLGPNSGSYPLRPNEIKGPGIEVGGPVGQCVIQIHQ